MIDLMTVSSGVNAATAAEFNTYMKRYPQLYRSMAAWVQQYMTYPTPVILDIGSGTGLLSLELRRVYPMATLLCLDPLRTMLRLAEENIREATVESLHLSQGVSEALPIQSATMDAVVSRFSLPYWTQPTASFQEIHRVLKPGGVVVLEGLNKNYPKWRLTALKVLMRLRTATPSVITYHLDAYKIAHTRTWVEDLFATSGFQILDTEGKPKDWRFLVIAQKKESTLL